MDAKFTKQLIAMSRGVFNIVLFNLYLIGTLTANDSSGQSKEQNKSIKEIFISIHAEDESLENLLKEIQSLTEFHFSYYQENVRGKSVTLNVDDESLAGVLKDISSQTNLSFKRIGKSINVLEPSRKAVVEEVLDLVDQSAVTGKITDEKGEPLPGATIVEKGTTNGTVTDIDGAFILYVKSEAILSISFVGYESMEIPAEGRSKIDISLKPDVSSLEEVVVVGYGSQRKSDLTGAVSSVKGEDLTLMPMQRVDQALQGRASGVLVLNTAGAPGAQATIRVRGMNSINGGNNALVVIDGLQGANLNSINPNDIESVEILKDASATAIYGARGANGVILITTKRGQKGKPTINYSYSFGLQSIRKKLDVMDAGDYARTINAWKATQNANGTPTPIFTNQQIQEFDQTGGTDWQDEIYRTAPIQNHQLSVGGGADNLSYMVSGGYLGQDGILLNSYYKRFTLRANLTAKISEKMNFGLNWAGSKERSSSPPYGGGTALSFLGQGVNIAPRWDPTTPPYDQNGNYNRHPTGYGAYDTWNPLAATQEPDIEYNTLQNYINTYLEYEIIEGLKLKITGGATIQNSNNKSYYNSKTWEGKPNAGKVGYGTIDESSYARYQNSNILSYEKNIADHKLIVMAVAEQQYQKTDGSGLVASKFTVDQTGINDLGGAEQISSKYSGITERVLNSYLGRINYSYGDRYLLTASYRADGSSVFGANNKWGYFPSVSLAWRLSEETFIKDINLFSDLKLRSSWGVTGNQAISPYQTFATIGSGYNYPYSGGGSTDLGFKITSAANPDLRWESTTQMDFGIDAGMYKGRLNITADIYKKTTNDLLLNRTLPSYTGLRSVIDNVGSVENKGLEIAISGDPLVNTLKWNTGFNISWNRNKVLDLGESDKLEFRTTYGGYGLRNGFMQLRVGEPFGQMYGYGYEGVWKESEAEQAKLFGQLPGDPKYTDVNGDNAINTDDIKIIGNSIPDFIFGWSNRLSYRGFEMNILIQGSKGNDIFNQGRIRLERPGEGTSSRLLDRWTPENQDTDVPAFIDEVTRSNAALANNINFGSGDSERLSRWVEDGSYVRLKVVTLGYNLPTPLLARVGFSRAKVYVSGTNLLTITNYTGYDPEVSAYNGNDAQIGVDLSNYPTAKTFTFGIDVSF